MDLQWKGLTWLQEQLVAHYFAKEHWHVNRPGMKPVIAKALKHLSSSDPGYLCSNLV